MRTHRSKPIALLLWILVSAAGSAVAVAEQARSEPRPFATIAAGRSRVLLARDGSIVVEQDDRQLISGTTLVVATPGWRTSVSQRICRPLEGYPRREEDVWVFKGEISEKGSAGGWRFEQRVSPAGKGVRVTYQVEPTADTQVAEIPVFIDLPLSQWSGKEVWLVPTAKGVFPAETPADRHFLSGPTRTVVLAEGDGNRLTLAFKKPTLCTVQDTRGSGGRGYQIYPRVMAGGTAKAGQVEQLEFVLTPDDPTEYRFHEMSLVSSGEPAITGATASATEVPQYRKFEIGAQISGAWDNPFDPAQVRLDAEFVAPDGSTRLVPGFFCQDYDCDEFGGQELLTPRADAQWKVRFAPRIPGSYHYRLRLVNQGKTVQSDQQTFTCVPNPRDHGYLRVSQENPYYLQFDDGTPFFAMGENVALLGSGGIADGRRWYGRLSAAGGNFVRSWWCYGSTDLESLATGRSDQGLGRYKQPDAWRIDRLVELAEQHGIRLMCCLETQQNLRRDKTWGQFTYGAATGGPAASPKDYFVNPQAKEFFRRRLRYIVARWSYSTAIFSWQFWNEVSACNDFDAANAAAWHQEMARYLREVDPVGHVIHTNFGNLDGYPQVDGLPEMEVVSTNTYSRRDMGQTAAWASREMTARYRKPFLITEYGVGHHGGWVGEDPRGVIVHNGLWGAVMNGSAGAALPWGWGEWVDGQDMYHYWTPLAAVVQDIPFCRRQWKPVEVERFTYRDGPGKPHYASVFFEGWPRNYSFTLCPPQPPAAFDIDADGRVKQQESFRGMLSAGETQTLAVEFPVDGSLTVHVPERSAQGDPILEVQVDGTKVLGQPLPLDAETAWSYWKFFTVPIRAGAHRIRVGNAGSGTFWTAYELGNYRLRQGPDLEVQGLQTDDYLLLWARNPQFIWLCAREGRNPEPQPQGKLTLAGVADGRYSVVWRDTITGDVVLETATTAENGRFIVDTPAVHRSAAARIVRTTGP
ncbi:MAG: DUF5060 domain-containing protein [Rhodopirellula sp.]|nr:DUF5060 domain-containing protein [Rhodopirellula sp.]